MSDFPSNVKQKLNSIIQDMSNHHWLFTNNPGRDFSRQHLGKLSFYDTMRMIIGMGKGSTSDEIMDYFELDPARIPSQSAFNQRRSQISLSAFEYLFSEFASAFPATTNSFKDHCILAFDGCHVVYTTNAEILEDYNKPHLIDYKGYNHMHLNGFVDVISKAFIDVVLQPGQHPDERGAMRAMLDHFHPDTPEKYIITADRGYESYDLLFQCELKKLHYVFRVKAPSSSRSILKIKTAEDTYEYIITNLPFSFDKNDIKDIYHWRWGIEVSFRYLKHANGLLHFHCKKPEFLKQEIYPNLVLYNFRIFLANEAAEENKRRKRKSTNKYAYEVDISTAIKLARKYFIRNGTGKGIDIIKLMMKYVHAVKTEFRQFARPLRGIGAIHFGYR